MSSPLDFDAPEQFLCWYPLQREAFEWALAQPQRHVGLAMPTGSGKSLAAYLLAKTLGLRTVLLTSRIGLAHQYADTFGDDSDVAEIHGWRNYPNKAAYGAALERALASRIIVTNYAYYLHAEAYGQPLHAQLLIGDEAAEAFKELGNFLSVSFSRHQIEEWVRHRCWPANPTNDPADWAIWAEKMAIPALAAILAERNWSDDEREQLTGILGGLKRLVVRKGLWVGTGGDWYARFAKVWPGEQQQELLARQAEKVVWLSATLRPKGLDLLHVAQKDRAFWEAPRHPFDWSVRPVYWIPTITATETRATAIDWRYWVTRLDQLVERKPKDLGLIHVVSYNRAHMYLTKSDFRGTNVLVGHGQDSKETLRAIEDWSTGQRPRVLVSPTLMVGWDLGQAAWQCIGKLPWPDGRDVLLKARAEADTEYAPFEVMQHIVQAAGRIARGPRVEDKGETYIIDDSISWFGAKYRAFAPGWWRVEKTDRLPTVGG